MTESSTDRPNDASPRRLHLAAAFVRVMTNVPYIALALVVGFFGGGDEAVTDPSGALFEGAIYLAVAFLFVAGGIVRWWRFRYWIADGEFRVLDGAFVRREIFIPFERIRTVEVNEGLWQRLFGVVRLQVKTGASGTQADLTAISRSEAERLQKALRKQANVDVEIDVAGVDTGANPHSASSRTKRTITIGELIATGATSGRLGYVLAVVAWLVNETADWTLEPLIDWAKGLPADETAMTTLVVLGLIAAAVALVVMFLGSVLAAVIKYGQFTVERDDDELVIRHGLINRQTITLPIRRIQAIRFVQNPIREMVGSGSLFVEAIGHAEEKGRSSELFPLVGADELDDFLREFLPEFCATPRMIRPPKRSIVRFFFAPVLVSLAVTAAAVWYAPTWGFWAALIVPLIALSRWLSYRQNGVGIDGDVAQVESRSLLSRQVTRLPRRAVRSVASSSNLFQARRDLGNLSFTVASGATGRPVTAINLDRSVADAQLDWTPGIAAGRPVGHRDPFRVS